MDVGTPLVNGARQTGPLLHTDGWRPGITLPSGTLLRIWHVHLLRVLAWGNRFLALREGVADAKGRMTLRLFPPLFPGETIDSVIVDNDIIMLDGIVGHCKEYSCWYY